MDTILCLRRLQFTANVADPLHRPELAWIGVESNEFGTDEFMKWCEIVDCEPYLCFNFGTGTLDEGLPQTHSNASELLLTEISTRMA